MRDVTIADQVFHVRAWKRKEIKAMKKAGFGLGNLDAKNLDAAMDYVFEKAFDPETIQEIEELDNKDVIKIWNAWLAENFGGSDEAKNS